MKAIEITDATLSFVMFLVAMNVKFIYDYGKFIILGTSDIDKFRSYCIKNGVRKADITRMAFASTFYEL